ncbi:beta-ketoacyl synthase [Neptuniibacter caesariensis]|uniref:Probable beta-ketoacyl synthase n=1 Tax=Neptuniibacter caesariensis TaxID=207954 RepID=A0A7U8C7I6_NEPCE|nr:beta-ketoacyl synthase [Neptuniibacter caesariensis]EAR63033.1 probable beta-ketoacyl synthase [Oceanospirillum sp. MED92] [Neptuniibacter caesariensis]
MSQLPVIVGFGGINPAGRASFHHAYRRLILDKLDQKSRTETLTDLAILTGLATCNEGKYINQSGASCDALELVESLKQQLLDSTLIRRVEKGCFDVEKVMFNKAATLNCGDNSLKFRLRKRQMPQNIPDHWSVTETTPGQFDIEVSGQLEAILPDTKTAPVQSAGQLPSGFQPGKLYQSRNHPKNLQMTVFAASDALSSTGIAFDTIAKHVAPDQIAVYASNSIGQLDDFGFGGLTKFPAIGKRTTSKQMPLGYAQMPADFVNAYILGNVGTTGGALGACATFLYNLRSGVNDIRSGKRKVALIGGSDAPVTPEIIEGFRAMGALAEDKDLLALDGLSKLTDNDYRKACRPFGNNCGFTIGESSQFVLLMSDDLAIELGAEIYGAVPEVFVNADGHKKSISAPGVGNYVTLAKSASLVRKMLGEESLKQRSFVQAHGTSTPQNRVTESHVINETAKAFGIQNWPVAAVKCYLGHSQGTAGGDQLSTSLGTWAYGYIPGIVTTPEFAEDVHQSNLKLSNQHIEVGRTGIDSVLLNSKGFGGNNASAPVLAPHIVKTMLKKRYSQEQLAKYEDKLTVTRQSAQAYDQAAIQGESKPIYLYDNNVLQGEDLQITDRQIKLPGYANPVSLDCDNPFEDMF